MNEKLSIPKHIAIIPDGNRRWAKKHNFPSGEGHKVASEKTLPLLIRTYQKLGVSYITFWALSCDNLIKRDKKECKHLLSLLSFFLKKKLDEFNKNGVKLLCIGNISVFQEDLQKMIQNAQEKTKDNNKITLIICLNYGGHDEILNACKSIISKKLSSDEINEELFEKHLYTKDIPNPDLIIRTGGETRTSGFLLWQSNYAEYYFSKKLFPDFSEEDCIESLNVFSERKRRFGA